MTTKLLRLDLPEDVWHRLNAEAADANQKIGIFARDLIVKRDARVHKPQVSGNSAE
jgi:hypothetical protein